MVAQYWNFRNLPAHNDGKPLIVVVVAMSGEDLLPFSAFLGLCTSDPLDRLTIYHLYSDFIFMLEWQNGPCGVMRIRNSTDICKNRIWISISILSNNQYGQLGRKNPKRTIILQLFPATKTTATGLKIVKRLQCLRDVIFSTHGGTISF